MQACVTCYLIVDHNHTASSFVSIINNQPKATNILWGLEESERRKWPSDVKLSNDTKPEIICEPGLETNEIRWHWHCVRRSQDNQSPNLLFESVLQCNYFDSLVWILEDMAGFCASFHVTSLTLKKVLSRNYNGIETVVPIIIIDKIRTTR